VLDLVLFAQALGVERLEADKEAAQPGGYGFFQQPRLEDRLHRARGLPETAHPLHAVEERGGKASIAKEMVVEKVEVAAWQPFDLGQRCIDCLGVKALAPLKERLLIAKVAYMGTAARDDDRVGQDR